MSNELQKTNLENSVSPDIRIIKPSKFEKFKKIYYIVYIILFILGFLLTTSSRMAPGGYSYEYGEYPSHREEQIGWYGLVFSAEGETWKDETDIWGFDTGETVWGSYHYTYPEYFAIFLAINTVLFASPLVYGFLRKKELQNTSIYFYEDRIYGSFGVKRKEVTIPFATINKVIIADNKSDKFKTGKTLEILHGNNRTKFRYIQNAIDVKYFIDQKRTSSHTETTTASEEPTEVFSDIEKIKKYKELLDMGAITQEEFDAKKKQILGL